MVEVKNEPHTFHLRQVSVMSGLHKCPQQIWPLGWQRAQQPYIFHKWGSQGSAARSGIDTADLWMDRSRRWWRRGLTTAPLCSLGLRWPLTAPCETLSLQVSQTSSGRFMGPSPLHRQPCCHLHSLHPERRGPHSPSVSLCPVTPGSLVAGQQQRGMCKTHNTGRRKYESDTQLEQECFSFLPSQNASLVLVLIV